LDPNASVIFFNASVISRKQECLAANGQNALMLKKVISKMPECLPQGISMAFRLLIIWCYLW